MRKLLPVLPKSFQELIKQIFIFFLGLIFLNRLIILVNSQLTFYSDDAIYAEIARFWIQGKFNLVFHPTWPPLYPFLSAVSYLFIKNWEEALKIVSLFSFLALSIPIYFFAKKFISLSSSLFILLSISFLSPVITISLFPQSDMLATTLIISALVTTMIGIYEKKYKLFSLSSFLLGLTYLTRSEGLIFFLLSIFYLTIWGFLQRKFFFIPVFAVIFFITISPYWIATWRETGNFSLSAKASAQIKQGQAFKINDKGSTWSQEVVSAKSPNYKSGYFKGWFSHLLEYSDWYWFWFFQKSNTWKVLFFKQFPAWSIPVILIGILSLIRKKLFWPIGFLVFNLTIGIPLTIFAVPIADIRYLLWAEILLVFFFFLGIKNLKLPLILSFAAIFLFPAISYQVFLSPKEYAQDFTNSHFRPEIKLGGEWLLKNSKEKKLTVLMLRHEGVEFYSDGFTVYTPQDITFEKTINYAKENSVDYLVAWSDELEADKNLSFLLTSQVKKKELIKVFEQTSGGRKLIIYRITYL